MSKINTLSIKPKTPICLNLFVLSKIDALLIKLKTSVCLIVFVIFFQKRIMVMREVAADRQKELLFQKAKEYLNHRYIFFQFGNLPLPPSMLGCEVFESVENIQCRLPSSTTIEMRPPPSQTPTPQRFDNFQPLWPPHFSSSSAQPQFKEPEPQPSTSFRPWLNVQEEHFRIVQTAPIRPLPPLKFFRKKHPSLPPDMNNFGETEIATNHQLEGKTFLIEIENATFEGEGERQTETFEGEGERQTETFEGEGERQTEEGERERQAFERTREEEERERQELEKIRERKEREKDKHLIEQERKREKDKKKQKNPEKG